MARLESIGKGRFGKAGEMIDGTPPSAQLASASEAGAPADLNCQEACRLSRTPGTQHDRDEPLN